MSLDTFDHDRSSGQDRIGDISWESILMETVSASVPRIDASCAETGEYGNPRPCPQLCPRDGPGSGRSGNAPALSTHYPGVRPSRRRPRERRRAWVVTRNREVALLRPRGTVFSFGPFQLFPSQRLLLTNDRKVQLGSRAFDILTVLVERAGEVVGKDELVARAWPNVFVEDSNLKTAGLRVAPLPGRSRRGRMSISLRYPVVAITSSHRSISRKAGRPDGPDPWRADARDHPNGEARRAGTAPMMSLPELIRSLEPCA